MILSAKFHSAEMERAIARLGERAPRAVARALNRAAVSTRVVWAGAVAKDLGLKVGTVREQMVIDEARPVANRLAARITVRGKRIPLIHFRARGPEPSRGRGSGVTYRLQGRSRLPHAFIATMPSGHRGVFERTAGKFMRGRGTRQAIHEKRGPSLPHVGGKHMAAGLARGEEALAKNMAHELKFALTQT